MKDPSYIRMVNLLNIVNNPYSYGLYEKGKFRFIPEGLQTNCEGMRPYKGRFADDVIIGRVNGAKSVLSNSLFFIRLVPILLFIPKVRLEAARRVGMTLFKLMNEIWEKIPDSDYSRPVRELNRAIDMVLDKHWQIRMTLNFKYTLLCILEFDDHYRFIFQDLMGSMDKHLLCNNPKREIKRLLLLASERSHFDGVKVKFKNFSKLVWLIPKSIIRKIVRVLLILDLSKVKLDEDDMDWAQDKPYDFGGVAWKGREYSLQRGQNNAIIKPMNPKELPKEELDAFNKELEPLLKKYNSSFQIKVQPQLIIERNLTPQVSTIADIENQIKVLTEQLNKMKNETKG